jgi:Flp pilus assembly protein TadD
MANPLRSRALPSGKPRQALGLGGRRALKGAALVVALLEAIAAQAKPETEALRLNARNTPLPGGDAYETGRGLLAAGDVTGAMAAFREALLEAPQSVDTLNAIAVCYDRLGRYDVSRSYYDAALAIQPGSVLVLNNLGYSLYLQGDLRGAIPHLQQVAAGGDPGAAATSRRLLQLIGVKLRESEARASMAQAVAELKSSQTRIELAANGEQRLVMAAKAPRAEVVASLGEAAELTVVPKVWTARDEARIEAAEAERQRRETDAILAEVAALTAADAALRLQNPVRLGDASAATAFAEVFAIDAAAAVPGVITPAAGASPAPQRGKRQAVDTALLNASAKGKGRRAVRKAMVTPAAEAEVEAIAAAALSPATMPGQSVAAAAPLVVASGYASLSLEAPAWIVASRRGAIASSNPTLVGQSPEAERATAEFDSDDPVLNAFAARMRKAGNDNVMAVSADVAIARLEALITRLRRA